MSIIEAVNASQHESEPEVSERERAHAKRILADIEQARKFDRDQRTAWANWRHYAATGRAKGTDEWLIDTNLIEATMEGLLPHLYARNPEIGCRPSEAVRAGDREHARDFGRTAEIVATRMLEDGRLKAKIKRLCRSAMTLGAGFLKVTLAGGPRDALASQTPPDSERDQILRVQRIDAELSDPACDHDRKLILEAEREGILQSLAERAEADSAKGLAIDVVPADEMAIPCDLLEVVDYLDAPWLAHRVWMTHEQAMERYGLAEKCVKAAKQYVSRADDGDAERPSGSDGDSRTASTGWLAVWEHWDRRTRCVTAVVEGLDRYAQRPTPPWPSTLRFYPFHLIAWHSADGERWPKSDVYMWAKLQDEYCRARSQWADHRRRSKPARFGSADAISPTDARKVTNPENNELILVNVPSGTDLRSLFAQLEPARIDPALYETMSIRQDLDQVSGLQDAARGAVIKPKTATEAEIMQSGMVTRVGERQDVLEDMIAEIAVSVIQMALQALTRDDVIRYAGESALWPTLDIRDIHQLLDIRVRAGSSGRQSRQTNQQVWSVLFPVIRDGITEIFALRASGQVEQAQAKEALLRETLRRADDDMDLDTIMPPAPVAAPELPMSQGAAVGMPSPMIPPMAGAVPA